MNVELYKLFLQQVNDAITLTTILADRPLRNVVDGGHVIPLLRYMKLMMLYWLLTVLHLEDMNCVAWLVAV